MNTFIRTIASQVPRLALALSLSIAGPLAFDLASTPARADIGPPRIAPHPRARPAFPARVIAWFGDARSAMADGKPDRARALCDERGFADNLGGSNGTSLASLFAQGHRKRWHLQLDAKAVHAGPKRSYIAFAHVVDNTDPGKRLDSLYVLFVPSAAHGYLALGASENKDEVEALARRWANGEALAPTRPEQPDQPDRGDD